MDREGETQIVREGNWVVGSLIYLVDHWISYGYIYVVDPYSCGNADTWLL